MGRSLGYVYEVGILRTLEALLIALLVISTDAYIINYTPYIMLSIPYDIGIGRVLAWLDSVCLLKKLIYSRKYDELNRMLLLLLDKPFSLEIYAINGALIFQSGSINRPYSHSIVYVITGVNGSFDPRIIVLRV